MTERRRATRVLGSVVAVPEAVDSNPATLRKHGASVDQILNNRFSIGLPHNEFVVEKGRLLRMKTNGGHPGVVIDIFHAISLGMILITELITITDDRE